jgi:hypothetical protein
MANASVLAGWMVFIFIFKGTPFGFCKNTFYCHLSPQLLVLCESIGEALRMVYDM